MKHRVFAPGCAMMMYKPELAVKLPATCPTCCWDWKRIWSCGQRMYDTGNWMHGLKSIDGFNGNR